MFALELRFILCLSFCLEPYLIFLVFHELIKRQSCYNIETSQLICTANQLTGFCVMATLAFNELIWDKNLGHKP